MPRHRKRLNLTELNACLDGLSHAMRRYGHHNLNRSDQDISDSNLAEAGWLRGIIHRSADRGLSVDERQLFDGWLINYTAAQQAYWADLHARHAARQAV